MQKEEKKKKKTKPFCTLVVARLSSSKFLRCARLFCQELELQAAMLVRLLVAWDPPPFAQVQHPGQLLLERQGHAALLGASLEAMFPPHPLRRRQTLGRAICQGPLNGGVSNGEVSRSGLVLPFLSLFVLFRTFPIFPGFSRFARGWSGDFPDLSFSSFSAY